MGTTTHDCTDETVVVTGGSSGIGRAVARRFGAAGATVIVADVREGPKAGADERPTHELVRETGATATFVETDVADSDQVAAVVEAAREFGGVDVMVNNAGVYRSASLLETDPDVFDTLYGINARGVFAGCRAAARDMLDRDQPGCILNTASISSELAQPGHTAYDATEGAIMMLTRVAALELADRDIRVNAVAPGPIDTVIGSENPDSPGSEGLPSVEKRPPMQRSADPEEVAGSYLFLASEDASYITGHLLYVDGGYRIV